MDTIYQSANDRSRKRNGVHPAHKDCKDQRKILLETDKDKAHKDMGEDEQIALEHYVCCDKCKAEDGLSSIALTALNCKEAQELWISTAPETRWDVWHGNPVTVKQVIAREHIFGRSGKIRPKTILEEEKEFRHKGCQSTNCRVVREKWEDLCGRREIGLPNFFINHFSNSGWPLNDLLDIYIELVEARATSIYQDLHKKELEAGLKAFKELREAVLWAEKERTRKRPSSNAERKKWFSVVVPDQTTRPLLEGSDLSVSTGDRHVWMASVIGAMRAFALNTIDHYSPRAFCPIPGRWEYVTSRAKI